MAFPSAPQRLLLMAALLAAGTLPQAGATSSSSCGTVSTFAFPPETQDIYPATIDRIDAQNVLEGKTEHRLPPGRHVLKVYERISAPALRVSDRDRGYSKLLTVDVEAGKVYRIGARFNRAKPFHREDYWQPAVWEVKDRQCQP